MASAVVFVMLMAQALGSPAHAAQQRFALLIGNQNYTDAVGPLTNPHNDIARVGAALKRLGFKVTLVKDAGFGRLQKAIKKHTSRLSRAGADAIGFFYYSGHGAAHATSRTNYLIPTDVASIDDEDLWDNSVRLTRIIDELRQRAGNATHFVVFDACRNKLKLKKKGSKALVQAKGFVRERRVPGILVAYATAEGDVASDIGQGVGPYAKILAEELVRPGFEAVSMFRNVQLRMSRMTKQWPWLDLAPLPEVYLAGRQSKPAQPWDEQSKPARAWEEIRDARDPAAYRRFVERFPDSIFTDVARMRLAKLQTKDPAPPSVRPGDLPKPAAPEVTLKSLTIDLQRELARVGCDPGPIDGLWGYKGRRALEALKKHANLKIGTVVPTLAALEKARQLRGRVCPDTKSARAVAARPTKKARRKAAAAKQQIITIKKPRAPRWQPSSPGGLGGGCLERAGIC
jgi:DNA-binding MarR family transcriptional regulator